MRRPQSSVVVVTTGAATSVGKTAASSAAAVRAGVSRIADHPFMFERDGTPLRCASATYLDVDLCGAQRLAAFVVRAAAEALAPIRELRLPLLPVFVGVPPPRPGRDPDTIALLRDTIVAEVVRAGLRLDQIHIFESGNCSGTMAIEAGWRTVQSGGADLALCGGVDSYRDRETMLWLQRGEQLHGADENAWGLIPGEGSAFTVLAAERLARRIPGADRLEMLAAATTRESNLIKTDAVCTGEGLTTLFRALAMGLPPGSVIDDLLSDMNGEPYRADEFGFAVARTSSHFRKPVRFTTPGAVWGDVGAATGPMLLSLAKAAAERGWARGPLAAAFTSAESGERSGFVTRRI